MKFAIRRGDGSWYVFVQPDGTNAYVDWRKDKDHATKWDKHEDANAVARLYVDVKVVTV